MKTRQTTTLTPSLSIVRFSFSHWLIARGLSTTPPIHGLMAYLNKNNEQKEN
jgi:hypothetical protein